MDINPFRLQMEPEARTQVFLFIGYDCYDTLVVLSDKDIGHIVISLFAGVISSHSSLRPMDSKFLLDDAICDNTGYLGFSSPIWTTMVGHFAPAQHV